MKLLRAVLFSVVLSSSLAEAQSPPTCDRLLSVELTPDVPAPRDAGFLGSLLGNQVEYRLILERQIDDSNIVVELTGPGPAYRCQEVIQAMRRDGRVLSIHETHSAVQ
jgi:hypothetical protein